MNKESIKFYGTDGDYGFMSNFYHAPFYCNDMYHWKTSEHYYQAMKVKGLDHNIFLQIGLAETPSQAAKLGRHAPLIRKDWDHYFKYEAMIQALLYKFDQNPMLKFKLLMTADKELIENSPYDSIWGCGKDGTGKNMLGITLMRLRDEYRCKDSRLTSIYSDVVSRA